MSNGRVLILLILQLQSHCFGSFNVAILGGFVATAEHHDDGVQTASVGNARQRFRRSA